MASETYVYSGRRSSCKGRRSDFVCFEMGFSSGELRVADDSPAHSDEEWMRQKRTISITNNVHLCVMVEFKGVAKTEDALRSTVIKEKLNMAVLGHG